MKESIFLDQIRDIFAILDRGIYSLITIFYDTIEQLAVTPILSGGQINDLAMNIYGLLSVFMIFKISFSLINFLVNPDLIADKAKGGATLIKNIIITFVLVITVPFAFDLLYRAQNVIISDGIIQKYILGGKLDEPGYSIIMDEDHCSEEATTNKVGDYIGLMAFKPFFQISEDSIDQDAGDFSHIENMYCRANTNSNSGKASVSNILKGRDVYDAPHSISFDHYYVVEYTIFLSSVIGIVIALLFLTFCFDVATRSIKLAFLELIAPIPIISYIDPDSSKNGMFKKWMKEVFNTWLSLFMRLAAIYFAIYIIGMLADMDIPGNSLWIKLLIIIGALIFAKQLPKMLENILGIKLGENFTLNPFKKMGNEILGAKQIATGAGVVGGTALGLAGGIAANAWATKVNNDKIKKDMGISGKMDQETKKQFRDKGGMGFFRTTGSLIGGGVSSALRSGSAGVKSGKFTPFSNASKGITGSSIARSRRDAGFGIKSKIVDKATDVAHISQSYGTTDIMKNEKKSKERELNELVAREESLRDQFAYYKSQNADKALAFNDANKFEWIEKDGKKQPKYNFETYDDYLNYVQSEWDKPGANKERLEAIGKLDRIDFERSREFSNQINDINDTIAKTKKEISKIEENMKKDK